MEVGTRVMLNNNINFHSFSRKFIGEPAVIIDPDASGGYIMFDDPGTQQLYIMEARKAQLSRPEKGFNYSSDYLTIIT